MHHRPSPGSRTDDGNVISATDPGEPGQQAGHVHQPNRQTQINRTSGQLRLAFAHQAELGRTVLASCAQRPPLKVVRAFPLADGAALVHLHNVSGGVLGGDQLEISVEVGPAASAQVTTTGATRLYRSLPHLPDATQVSAIIVRKGGLLEYLPDPLIPFAGARYRQRTTIQLESDAGLFWWEAVAPGRAAGGEIFAFEKLELSLEISAAGSVIALERNRLEPRLRPLTSLARLGRYHYFASFYACRVGLAAADWLTHEKELREIALGLFRPDDVLWGISTLPAHGLVVRALSTTGPDVMAGLKAFWRAAKMKLYGREAILPRKVW